MVAGTHLYLVGYGRSGDGVNGYTTNASFTVKRTGQNIVETVTGQDDASPTTSTSTAKEVFQFDFDAPLTFGQPGGSLGNDKETTLGGGDSGGPSFVLCTDCNPALASSYSLAGVNTFTQGLNAPKFGSSGGGINVFPYRDWILGSHPVIGGGSGGGGGGGSGSSSLSAIEIAVLVALPADSDSGLTEFGSYVGASVAISSPVDQATSTAEALADLPQTDWLVDPLPGRAASGKRDRLEVALGHSGTSDEAQTDDFTLAVDSVLCHWIS
jgi:hypothetical protein